MKDFEWDLNLILKGKPSKVFWCECVCACVCMCLNIGKLLYELRTCYSDLEESSRGRFRAITRC